MSYKFSLGERTFDDIIAEVDAQANTKIDFEEDYIGLVTSGSSTLVASGSMVGIGTSTPAEVLTLNATDPTILFSEGGTSKATIGVNSSDNILIENKTINKHIVFKVNDQGVVREGLRLDGAVPEVVVNQTSDSLVDFRVESNNHTHMLFIDGSTNKIGINTDSPAQILDINGDTIRLRSQRTIPNSNTFGEAGEICYDANYIYICVATDTWKRIALSSW